MSEAVTGFDKDDVTAPNGTLGDLSTENNITFTGTFTPNASTEDTTNVAVVGTGFTDVALNPALTSAGATSANYAIDTLGPRRGSRSTTTTTTTVTDPITTPTTPTAPTAPTPYFFSTTMRIGSYAGEVLPLQQFLASKGYFTDTLNGYFGQTTFLAVKAYQKANGLGDDGIVGPMTRSVLNGAQNPSVPSEPTTPLTPSAYTYNFGTKLLMNGSRGDDVKELQRFLNKALGLGLVEDGILGPKTIGVIKEWQKSQGLKDDGIVGPLTKAKMLELAKGFK
jgi:peptidoglycan hydrolase-like protein with peptidoglycan-binding domain